MSNLPIEPYRSIGSFVSSNCSNTYSIDKKSYLVCPTGFSYKILSLPDLKIKILSPSLPEQIKFVNSVNEFTFALTRSTLYKFNFSHLVKSLNFEHSFTAFNVLGKMLFMAFENGTIEILDSQTLNSLQKIQTDISVKHLFHPENYLNKILVSNDSTLLLYNVKTNKLIFNFLDEISIAQLFQETHLSIIANSPASDVIGLGFNNGKIAAINLKTTAQIFEFNQHDPVTSLVFSRNTRHSPRLFSANSKGDILLWNLNTFTLEHKLSKVFQGSVSQIFLKTFNDNDFLICTSAADNCIKEFVVEENDSQKLISLRKRQGVTGCLKKIRFYNNRFIIGISDSISAEIIKFSIFNDSASVKLSHKIKKENADIQSEIQRNTNDLLDFCFSELNGNIEHSNNLFTLHAHSAYPLFWDLESARLNNVFLELKSEFKAHVSKKYKDKNNKYRELSAVQVSHCGSFLFSGFDNGLILKQSTQSGKLSTDFNDFISDQYPEPITFIFCDANSHYIIVGSNSRFHKLDFFKGSIITASCILPQTHKVFFDKNTELLTVCAIDGTWHIYSTATCQRIRLFQGSQSIVVNDLVFASADKKMIIATNEFSLLIFDIFLNIILTEIKLPNCVVSLDISEELGFVAVVFENSRDISLWNINNLHLKHDSPIPMTFVSPFKCIPADPRSHYLSSPQTSSDFSLITGLDNASEDTKQNMINQFANLINETIVSSTNLTFSDVPISKWKTLLYFDQISHRNELEASKFEQTEELPFFLKFGDSLLDSIEQQTKGTLEETPKPNASKQTRHLEENQLIEDLGDEVVKQLNRIRVGPEQDSGNRIVCVDLLKQLKSYSPAETDYFIKRATVFNSEQTFKLLVFFEFCLAIPTDYDFKNALFKYFLTVY